MSRATTVLKDLAGWLVAAEIAASPHNTMSPTPRPAAFLVCEKLSPLLATLMGRRGAHALLYRALALAENSDWLSNVLVSEQGDLEIPDQILCKLEANETTEGSTRLVAELLGLLVGFIGPSLTLRLVRDLWPTVPEDALNFASPTSRTRSTHTS